MNDKLEHLKKLLITASSLIDNKKYDEAIQSLLAIESSFPNIANIRWLIGTAFTHKGNYFEAIKSYSDAFKLNANLPFIEFKKDNIEFQLSDIPGSNSCVIFLKELYDDIYGLRKLDLKPNEIVIDVGANIGSVSIFLAKKYPNQKILAFEPCKKTFQKLLKNLETNFVTNVEAFNYAVSGDGRDLTLLNSPTDSGMANAFLSTELKKRAIRDYGFTAEVVPSKTLDQIFLENKIQECSFLKLDCEGAEFEIIKNTKVLDNVKNLAAELHITSELGAPQPKSKEVSDAFWQLIVNNCRFPPNLGIASIVHVAIE